MDDLTGNTAPHFRRADCCGNCKNVKDVDCRGEGHCNKHTQIEYDYNEKTDVPKPLEIMNIEICDDFVRKKEV